MTDPLLYSIVITIFYMVLIISRRAMKVLFDHKKPSKTELIEFHAVFTILPIIVYALMFLEIYNEIFH